MPEILVISTFPDIEKARQIGTILVEKQLAACVNLIPSAESIYRWKDEVETAQEVVAFIKSTRSRYPQLEAEVLQRHPYDVPEIIAVDISQGLPDYLRWISDST